MKGKDLDKTDVLYDPIHIPIVVATYLFIFINIS